MGSTIGTIACPFKTYLKGQEDMSKRARPSFLLIELQFDRNIANFVFQDPAIERSKFQLKSD